MAPPCRYEAGLVQASHVAMQPHGTSQSTSQPASQPASQQASQTHSAPASPASQLALKPPSQPTTHTLGQATNWPPRLGPGQATAPPGQLAVQQASPVGGPNNPTASQQLATQVPSCSQPASLLGGWPASRPGRLGGVGEPGRPGHARLTLAGPLACGPRFWMAGHAASIRKNCIQGGSILIWKFGPKTWDHL